MLEPVEAYKKLLNDIHSALKENGYRRRNYTFYKQNNDNIGIIGFQKCRYTTQSHISFVINLGIYSQKIQDFIRYYWDPVDYSFLPVKPVPSATCVDAHWCERICEQINYSSTSNLRPTMDRWYNIINSIRLSTLQEMLQEILDPLNKAILEIEKYINYNDLLGLWKSNHQLGERSKFILRRSHRPYKDISYEELLYKRDISMGDLMQKINKCKSSKLKNLLEKQYERLKNCMAHRQEWNC